MERNELMKVHELVEHIQDTWTEEQVQNLIDMPNEQVAQELGITLAQADMLWLVVSGSNDPSRQTYELGDEYATLFLGTVQEALHQGLDGWEPEEQMVIRAFLSDITFGTIQSR